MSDTENKLVDQTESIQLGDQEPKRRSNVVSNQNSTVDRDLVAPSQRKNRTQSVCYNLNDAFKSGQPDFKISKNSLNSLRRNRDENEGRELRCSNARINLQENNNEVVYASGRKSIVVKNLETNFKRVSVIENIGESDLRKSYLQNLTSSGNLLGDNSSSKLNNVTSLSPLAEVDYKLTNAEEYEQESEDPDDQYYNNFRRGSDEQENLHRISSVISNKEERLSRELKRTDSTLPNEDIIKERANNPQARKRPTSAGLQSKNSRYSTAAWYDFENRCLSDTELDTMEIELANDLDGPFCLTNQLII